MLTEIDFNPPAPGGAGHKVQMVQIHGYNFNPPAPGGAGLLESRRKNKKPVFQSTRPGWGGTQ